MPVAPTFAQKNDGLLAARVSPAREDELHEQIGLELNSGSMHTATWLKAFAHANGVEIVAKEGYIKLRIEKFLTDNVMQIKN